MAGTTPGSLQWQGVVLFGRAEMLALLLLLLLQLDATSMCAVHCPGGWEGS